MSFDIAMKYEQLKLDNQLCFPVYAASRLITHEYKPLLDRPQITYPQYLVLMVLWENEKLTVNAIAKKLLLQTNTVTPLLKRLEKQGLIVRERSYEDERKVMVHLSKKGIDLQEEAAKIPEQLASGLISDNLQVSDLIKLKEQLHQVIDLLSKNKPTRD